jgi:hypothetical protein
MVEQQQSTRVTREKRRVMVRFGIDRPEKTGFTMNVSRSGMFLRTNTVFKPGTRIQLEIVLPDRSFGLWAQVVWAKKVPPQLAHVLDCGMGVRFLEPLDEWLVFHQTLVRR